MKHPKPLFGNHRCSRMDLEPYNTMIFATGIPSFLFYIISSFGNNQIRTTTRSIRTSNIAGNESLPCCHISYQYSLLRYCCHRLLTTNDENKH